MARWQLGIVVWFGLAFAARAQEPPPGFQPLWNGRDFSGWQFVNCTEQDWRVEDGVLATRAGKVRNSAWILTETEYDDFELRLEYQLTKGADSGVALRTAPTGAPYNSGMEIQLVDESSFPRIKPEQTTGAIWDVKAPAQKAAKPLGEWNELHVTLQDRKLQVVLNGTTVQDVDLDDLAKAVPKHRDGLGRDVGHVGLQTRLGVAKFRNVFLKPLSEPPPPGKITLALDAGGHTGRVGRVFFTHDGKHLVTGSADHTVRVWDVATGEQRRVLRPPGHGDLSVMAVSPTEDKVAVACQYPEGKKIHHVLYVMRLGDGQVERVLRGHQDLILAVGFSADGKRLASSAEDKSIRVWDPATGKVERVLETNIGWRGIELNRAKGPGQLALSPTGNRVVYLTNLRGGPAHVVEVATGRLLAQLQPPKGGGFSGVAWSPDGQTIATCGPGGGSQFWSPDGKPGLQPRAGVSSVAFSQDSRHVVATWEEHYHPRAAVFDRDTGKEGATFAPKTGGASQGALSPDGQLAATSGGGWAPQAILWKTATGETVHRLALRTWLGAQHRAAWSPDGRSVAWGSPKDKTRPVFDFGELQLGTAAAPGDLRGPSLQEGGLALERQEGGKRYWERQVVQDGQVIARLGVPHRSHVPSGVSFVGPERVAMGGDWGGFFLYDVASQRRVREFRTAAGRLDGSSVIGSVAASPARAHYLATLGIDQMLRIWDPERERPLLTLFVNGEDWILWTEEGYYAATPGGERLVGWTVDNGIDRAATYYPAEQFRKVLYRPDVLRLVLEKGSVAEAVKAANAGRQAAHREVPKGIADPEKLLPPGVRLAVVDASKKPKLTFRVEAAQACPEQPIKSLRLFLDGRPLPPGEGYVSFPDGQEKSQYAATWTVELPAGKHKLFALARGKDDTPNASNAVEVETPLPREQRPVLHHLAVGISDYDRAKLKLSYAHRDAQSLQQAFRKSVGPGRWYEAAKPTLLLEKDATRQAVLGALDAIRKDVKANDLLVFSFAGHGLREEGEFYLLTREADPTDARTLERTALSGTALRQKLADFPCQVLLLLDACHSGSLGGGLKPGSDEAARALADVETRVAVMCAALGHEEAFERPGKGGLFTEAVVRALGHDPNVFFDKQTGEMNVSHLYAFVYQVVAKDSEYKQSPYVKMPLAHPPFVITKF